MKEVTGQTVDMDSGRPEFTNREKLLTMFGVLLVMLLASLDQTIVSTAMPRIIGELNGIDRYTWVSTAYLLASTVMIPIYGKLSDMFGRKLIFLIGVILFLAGSAMCGAAQDMNQLIAFRAFQGLGAAALMPIAMAVVGDLFTPRERGKWQGVTGSIFGLSSVLGPTVGGWITENVSWRWVFYVNLPVGVIALLVLIFLMPALHTRGKDARVDYIGCLFLVAATVPMMLGLSWGGSEYPWLSWQVLGLIIFGLVFFVVFFSYEAFLARREKQPIIDPGLFKNNIFSISVVITMLMNMGLFGCIFFLPLYAQGVLGISATNSGLILSPMMISMIITSVFSGFLVSKIGKYKIIAISGMIVALGGALLLLRLDINSVWNDLLIAMIVMGLGLGFGMSLYTLIVQNSVPYKKMGQATSALTFFRQIGSTIALSAMGSIMNTGYVDDFHNALPAKLRQLLESIPLPTDHSKTLLSAFDNPNVLTSPDMQEKMKTGFIAVGKAMHVDGLQMYNQVMEAVKVGLTQGIHNVFILGTMLMALALVVVFFLKEIPLRGKSKPAEAAEDAANAVSPVAIH
uniref:Major facilitator superfamily (MFS) profile domain-containing protein n=1 Tax=Thermosporothrix sp. COM3 TaxID=2490863 RepID=A0A455SLT0_9CHLR|nr:hypothetical protein KTC_41540 [Thermosporothrix sp. COM3]